MATFPTLLKTGAIAQYPLNRVSSLSTQSVRFLNGSRQTYQLSGLGLRRWILQLNQLDEAEVGGVIAFAEKIGTGTFSFTNPVTGEVAAKCILSGQQLSTSLEYELNGSAILQIEEVK